MAKYKLPIALTFIILFEIAALQYLRMATDIPSSKLPDYIAHYGPGIWFSLFVILPNKNKWSLLRMLATFSVLVLYYLAAFLACFITWGFAVPVVATIGALVIKKSLHFKSSPQNQATKKYLLAGFTTGLLGLILYYLSDYIHIIPKGSLEVIIIPWQIWVGYLVIKDLEAEN